MEDGEERVKWRGGCCQLAGVPAGGGGEVDEARKGRDPGPLIVYPGV